MARKAKTDKNAPGADAEKPKIGDNGPPLSDDDLRTLAFQHKDKYAKALAAKKKTDADFRNVCKLAKAEMGDGAVEMIKDMIALEDEEGEARVRAKIKRQADALRWMGMPLGTQIELQLLTPGEQSSVDHAYNEGIKASQESKPAKPIYAPETPQYRAYLDGYSVDQEKRLQTIGRG